MIISQNMVLLTWCRRFFYGMWWVNISGQSTTLFELSLNLWIMNKSNLNASPFSHCVMFLSFSRHNWECASNCNARIACTLYPPTSKLASFSQSSRGAPSAPVAKVRAFPQPHILRKVVQVQVLHHCKSKNFSRTSATRYPPPDTFYVMGGKLAHINDFSNLGHGGHPIWGQAG